jgi:hypothetical protein
MSNKIGHQLRACGRYPLPEKITVAGLTFEQVCIFKHDFFAATALYERAKGSDNSVVPQKMVLKVGRHADLLGIPLAWLGELLCCHEWRILTLVQGMPGIPKLSGRHGKTGFVYEYIEGCSLDERPKLPDDFFDQLESLLEQIHARRIAYVDMNKRGNILLGRNGTACLIDFQISFHIPRRLFGSQFLADCLLNHLRKEDLYHLGKHKRRLRGDLMTAEQIAASRRISGVIALHRTVTRPLTGLRRAVLKYLFRTGRLAPPDPLHYSPETDPARWSK